MHTDSGWRHVVLVGACAVALTLRMPSVHATTDTGGGVTLTAGSVNASGITTVALQATKQTDQVQATASVLDPQPLLALAAQLQAAHADAMAAAVAAHSAGVEAKRTAALYHDGENASLQQVQATAAVAAQAQAQRLITQAQEVAARSRARAQWGRSLATLAARGPQALNDYADGHRALLAVVVPAALATPPGNTIALSLPGRGPLPAHLIGASPRADAVVQGATFFYRADGAGLRTDQRLSASVPLGGTAQTGVTVPAAAVIWYAGQPWAYVETAAGHYRRRPLRVDARNAGGWFEPGGFRAGERVVVRGGELLLSQELLPPPGMKPAGGDDDDD
jgi:membrane fusion protein, multidrug efflux system